jgi:hypothetical protein
LERETFPALEVAFVAGRGLCEESADEHVVVAVEIAWVAYADGFEESVVGAHDVVATRPNGVALSGLLPCLSVAERFTLLEVEEEVVQSIRSE